MSLNIVSIFLIAVALAMDAFSVSLTKGFTQKNLKTIEKIYYGLFFGGFQFIMPIFGYYCVSTISDFIQSFASIIGFVLLVAIGLNMIRESLSGDDEEITDIVDRIAGKQEHYIIKTVPQDAHLAENQKREIRCGDNGIFKGVPTTKEQKELATIARRIYETVPHDGKYIISDGMKYVCQSNTDDKTEKIINTWVHPETLNPLGRWTGGTYVDTGATNRKLGSDMGDAVTGGGLHGKDLSKADVSVNVYLWLMAQANNKSYEAFCTIGSDNVLVREYGEILPKPVRYSIIVKAAREIIDDFGGFEKLAEWGLIHG